ncbi:hypothetical protein COLO4_03883 [Corchorus olitorius]|uniref:Uncharacterized protein n=1 Tax=Corchorus olitorius TaxID=93759 RepID=A0A1R3KW77_9ROSI|nr:hypothetical protein COLO4_03883 [Corchorus olitorius]
MWDQLSALNSPVPQEDLVQSVVLGLPSEFSNFKRSLNNRTDAITFDDLCGNLLGEEETINQSHKTTTSVAPTALLFSVPSPRPSQPYFTNFRGGGRGTRGRGRGRFQGVSLSFSGAVSIRILSVHLVYTSHHLHSLLTSAQYSHSRCSFITLTTLTSTFHFSTNYTISFINKFS